MTGKLVDEIVKITDDGIDEPECTICLARKPSISLCRKLEQLAQRGNSIPAVEKLCVSISDKQLETVVTKLLMLQNNEIQAFLGDITNTSVCSSGVCLANNVSNLTPEIISTWQYVYSKHTDNAPNARKDWNTLLQFGKLNDRAKELVILFSDGDTKRLINFCVDLPKTHKGLAFLDFVNDAKNDKYLRGFVKKNLSEEDQQDLEGILADWTKQNDENPEVQKWLLYGENSTRFQKNRTLGNDLSANISNVFQNKIEPYYSTWASQIGLTKATLDQYQPLLEIPLNTSGGFMKADILLVKRMF
jgi:hypothetical protein